MADAWDLAMRGLSDLELELIIQGAKNGTLKAVGAPENSFGAGLKAAMELNRRTPMRPKELAMPNEVKLLPCPFCGFKADMHFDGGSSAWVECSNDMCFVQPSTVTSKTKPKAAAEWNTRPTTVVAGEIQSVGVPPSGSGHSAEPEPCSTVSAVPVSVPNALLAQCIQAVEFYALPENWHGVYMCGHGPMVDDWAEDYDDHQYPDGKPGKLARETWRALSAAGLIASAIEAPWVETEGLDAEHESAVAKPDAQGTAQ